MKQNKKYQDRKYKVRRFIAEIIAVSLLVFIYDAILVYGIIK